MTIELKRLPGLEGEPRLVTHLPIARSRIRQFGTLGELLYGPYRHKVVDATSDWNAMIDRIIEECRPDAGVDDLVRAVKEAIRFGKNEGHGRGFTCATMLVDALNKFEECRK